MSYWYLLAPIALVGFLLVRAISRSVQLGGKQDSGGWDPGYAGYGDSSGFAATDSSGSDAQADEACGTADSDSGGSDGGGDCGGGDGGGGGGD